MIQKCIVFDFDGVIIDSLRLQKYAFFESYRQIGGKGEPDFREFLRHGGNALERIITQMGLPLQMVEVYRRLSRENLRMIQLMPGMQELLQMLQQKGVPLGICTGKDRLRTLEILEYLRIGEFFSAIVCSDEVSQPKPHPESLLKTMELLGTSKEQTLMVGDSRNDLYCAKAAGVRCVFFATNPDPFEFDPETEADIVCETVSELHSVIRDFCKPDWLIHDLVVLEDNCNQQCEYCLTGTSNFKAAHCADSMSKPSRIYEYQQGNELQGRLDQIVDHFLEQFNITILKVSGGEIFLIKNIMEFFKTKGVLHPVLQVLTNGVLLNESLIAEYASLGNVSFQLSLDHHTLEGNLYRSRHEKLLHTILTNLEWIVKYKIPLEINCVLTDRNAGIVDEFARYLIQYGSKVKLFPFPIRGKEAERFFPGPGQFAGVERLLEDYDELKTVLPPRIYLEHLVEFLRNQERRIPCVLPMLAIGTFDDGIVTPCPNVWLTKLGNVLTDDPDELFRKIGTDKIYRLLRENGQSLAFCKRCFTPWEMLNIYMAGQMSLDELCESPLYQSPAVRNRLPELYRQYKELWNGNQLKGGRL